MLSKEQKSVLILPPDPRKFYVGCPFVPLACEKCGYTQKMNCGMKVYFSNFAINTYACSLISLCSFKSEVLANMQLVITITFALKVILENRLSSRMMHRDMSQLGNIGFFAKNRLLTFYWLLDLWDRAKHEWKSYHSLISSRTWLRPKTSSYRKRCIENAYM